MVAEAAKNWVDVAERRLHGLCPDPAVAYCERAGPVPRTDSPGHLPAELRSAAKRAVREAGRAGLLGHDGRRGSARPRRLLGALPAPHPWLNRCCGGRQAGPHLSMR